MNRWDSVEIFIHVVEADSFSAAARQLEVSKSHISRQVSQLENRLGVQLLNRTTRRLSLTETGKVYYERCRRILNDMEETDKALVDLQDTPRGTLRVTVAGAFGERYVAPAAATFMLQHVDLNIDLNFTSRNVDIVEEGYDLAIRTGVLKDSSLIAKRIGLRRVLMCGSRDYLDQFGEPTTIQDLKKHSCLRGSNSTWRLMQQNGKHTDVKIDGRWHSNNGYALLEAAVNGLGLVQLPEFYVYNDLRKGRLISVMHSFQPTDSAVWAVYPSSRHLSPKVRLFIDYLSEKFQSVDYL